MMWLVFGLGLMGYLLGFLAGMTQEAMVQPLVALLFAFLGGSIFVLLAKLTAEDRALAGKMLGALSLFCILGVVTGVVILQHRWLSPHPVIAQDVCSSKDPPPACIYLRSAALTQANIIDQQKRSKLITSDDAYEQLYKIIQDKDIKAGER
jgi:hypothetical protein